MINLEKIIPVNVSEQFKTDYQRYGIYVTYKRILSDMRDGLKPVQRRVLYTMLDIGATDRTMKSATITGSCMRFHPHGTSGIYDSMKSMTNWFESYLPLLTPQGNFGSFFGEPASAERYTESKLSKFALEYVVGDLREAPESIDWEPNYDNTSKEPSYLPAAIPILLINGSFGIGLGKKVDIPSHNTNEVIDAMISLIRNPNTPITLIPDTCMNCEIFDDSNWEEISNTGYGYFTVRGIAKIETFTNDKYKNRPAVVIYSVPDMVYIERIKEQIEKLVEKKKLVQVDDMYDESSANSPRFVIVLKQGSDPEYVRNVLYQNTYLQVTQRINFEFLNGLTPVRMSYRDYLLNFIENRKQVKYRVFINRLRVVETKIHEKDAFIKLLESPKFDEIIDKIRKFNKNDNELIEYIIKQLNITDVQARYIVDSRLRGITKNSLSKLKEDMKVLNSVRDTYMDLVVNESSLTDYIILELEDIKAKYGCARRSKLIHKPGSKDAIPSGGMLIAITEKGFIKKVPTGTSLGNFRNDVVKNIIEIDNADNLVIFDSSGKVYKLPIYKLPFGDKNNSGVDLKFIFKTFNGVSVNAFPESILKKYIVKNKSKPRFGVVTLTKQGFIKKMEVEEFLNITAAGLTYAKMDAGDYIQSVNLIYSEDDIIVFNNSKAMKINSGSIPTMKRAARGNMTMRSKNAEGLTVGSVAFEYVLVITKSGKINKIPVKGVPGLQGNKKEFSLIRLGKTDSIQNILFADSNQNLVIKCLQSGYFTFPVSTIAMGSSISGGDKVLSLKNDQIVYSNIQ